MAQIKKRFLGPSDQRLALIVKYDQEGLQAIKKIVELQLAYNKKGNQNFVNAARWALMNRHQELFDVLSPVIDWRRHALPFLHEAFEKPNNPILHKAGRSIFDFENMFCSLYQVKKDQGEALVSASKNGYFDLIERYKDQFEDMPILSQKEILTNVLQHDKHAQRFVHLMEFFLKKDRSCLVNWFELAMLKGHKSISEKFLMLANPQELSQLEDRISVSNDTLLKEYWKEMYDYITQLYDKKYLKNEFHKDFDGLMKKMKPEQSEDLLPIGRRIMKF